jgi:hypothetical protein
MRAKVKPASPEAVRLNMVYWPIGRFTPYLTNPRKHELRDVEQLAEAIAEFGFVLPVLARESGELVDGHLRIKAAYKVGLAEIPVITVDHLSPAKIRALRLSINRMAELAKWDNDLLLQELEQIDAEGEVDLDEDGALGFELEEIDEGADADAWDFAPTRDLFVVTITGALPIEADVRERLRGLEGVTIEASTLQKA